MKQGIKEFYRKYVLVQSDKATNGIAVVCGLHVHHINTLKQELNGTKAYEETSNDEKTVVNSHSNELPYKFAMNVKERPDKLPTMFGYLSFTKDRIKLDSWPTLVIELSKLLTDRLNAVKPRAMRYMYYETVYEMSR